MKKINILFATEDFYPSFIGGQGVWGGKLVAHLERRGVRVTVLAEKREERNAPNVILVPFCFGNQLLLALFEYLYFIVVCRTEYFDIVHANQLTALFFILFRPKNIGRTVVSVHNTWDQMGRHWPLIFLESYIFRHADGLLFHTESEKRYALKRYKLAGKVTAVVPIGTHQIHELSPEARRMLRNQLAIPEDASVVLYVGRLVRRKHVDTILRALKLLQKRRRNILGIIIGQGADRTRLESMSPPNVRFYGFTEDVEPYFQASDIFVLPSVAEGGVALAAYEAAAYGLALLLSPDAADPHILKDGENGFIVSPTDADVLAEKITDAIRHRNAFGLASRQKAGKRTWEATAAGTISFYRRLLGTGANTG